MDYSVVAYFWTTLYRSTANHRKNVVAETVRLLLLRGALDHDRCCRQTATYMSADLTTVRFLLS